MLHKTPTAWMNSCERWPSQKPSGGRRSRSAMKATTTKMLPRECPSRGDTRHHVKHKTTITYEEYSKYIVGGRHFHNSHHNTLHRGPQTSRPSFLYPRHAVLFQQKHDMIFGAADLLEGSFHCQGRAATDASRAGRRRSLAFRDTEQMTHVVTCVSLEESADAVLAQAWLSDHLVASRTGTKMNHRIRQL